MADLEFSWLANEDPLAKLIELRAHWYIAFFLITSNLAAWWGTWYFWRLGLTYEMAVVGGSAVISMFYHTCQTTAVCFHLGIERWTITDHITASWLLAMLVVLTINSYTLDEVLARLRRLWPTTTIGATTEPGGVVLPAFPEQYARDVLLNHRWSAAITYCYVVVVILSTICHPYSMQAFLIVIAFGMGALLIKCIVLDGGNPESILRRISVPDLACGLVLIAVSLVFFVADSYAYYWEFHTLWHLFSYAGVYFYAAGITRGLPGHFSPVGNWSARVAAAKRRVRARKQGQAKDV